MWCTDDISSRIQLGFFLNRYAVLVQHLIFGNALAGSNSVLPYYNMFHDWASNDFGISLARSGRKGMFRICRILIGLDIFEGSLLFNLHLMLIVESPLINKNLCL